MSGSTTVNIQYEEVIDFCQRCMTQIGTRPAHALSLAQVLAMADYRGHFSHGFNRLEMYVNDIKSGITVSKDGVDPKIVKETVSTAYVNGSNCLGPVVGQYCMDLAITKAINTGIGFVVANGSNHYGIAGYYSLMAKDKGLIGMSMTNTSPLVYPTRSKQLALGTNPITLTAPASNHNNDFVLDMATSTAAAGKVEMCRRKQVPIPMGWAADKDGHMTTDANEAMAGGLLPLGGSEETGGYKGYGLAFMVEVLCGVLANGAMGPNVRKWMNATTEANLGQCFMAINPQMFGDGFDERMDAFANTIRNIEPVSEDKKVLIPGDPERAHIQKCDKEGISYPAVLIDSMHGLADKLSISRLTPLP